MGELNLPLTPAGEQHFTLTAPGLSDALDVAFSRGETGAIDYMTLGYRVYIKQ